MKNSDVKLNELISDLSEPTRSIVVFIILSQKIRNHVLSEISNEKSSVIGLLVSFEKIMLSNAPT